MKHLLNVLAVTLGFAALPMGSAQAQTMTPAEQQLAAENFLQADADADGALTRSEFETLINLNADDKLGRAEMIRRLGRYDMAFGRANANGDAFVTAEEIQEMAAQASN